MWQVKGNCDEIQEDEWKKKYGKYDEMKNIRYSLSGFIRESIYL